MYAPPLMWIISPVIQHASVVDDPATAETTDLAGHAFGSRRVVQEVDADIGALARQRDGDRATDTLLGARDERHRA